MSATDDVFRDEPREPEADGAALLGDVHAALIRYVAFPSAEAADAVTLFIAATHAQPAWEHATRLVIKSPLKRCGKTRLQEVAGELCHRVLRTTNISAAALVRSIDEDDPPTIMLDEADTVFAKRRGERSEGAEDIRGIVNSGHARGWPYIRWDATARKREECPTFCMAVIGGIGDLPDTIEDRAVIVAMRRRAPGETVAAWRRRRAVPPLQELRSRLHAWVRGALEILEDAEPELPVEDRAADVWEPLAAIADLAGGDWPERARRACLALTGETDPDDATAGERLLHDLRAVFGDADYLATVTILERLSAIEEAPWGDWYGRALTPRDLARLLKPYGVKSRTVRTAAGTSKGYARADLADSWRRYDTSVTPSHGDETAPLTSTDACDGSVTDSDFKSDTRPDQQRLADVTDVTAVSDARPNGDRCPECDEPPVPGRPGLVHSPRCPTLPRRSS